MGWVPKKGQKPQDLDKLCKSNTTQNMMSSLQKPGFSRKNFFYWTYNFWVFEAPGKKKMICSSPILGNLHSIHGASGYYCFGSGQRSVHAWLSCSAWLDSTPPCVPKRTVQQRPRMDAGPRKYVAKVKMGQHVLYLHIICKYNIICKY